MVPTLLQNEMRDEAWLEVVELCAGFARNFLFNVDFTSERTRDQHTLAAVKTLPPKSIHGPLRLFQAILVSRTFSTPPFIGYGRNISELQSTWT